MAKHSDPVGRTVGIVVFLLGIFLLALIAKVAYTMLTNPVPELAAVIASANHPLKPGQTPPPTAFPAVGAAVVAFLLKLTLLFVGIAAGSVIAGKGIHLYFAAASHAFPTTGASGNTPSPDDPSASTTPLSTKPPSDAVQ